MGKVDKVRSLFSRKNEILKTFFIKFWNFYCFLLEFFTNFGNSNSCGFFCLNEMFNKNREVNASFMRFYIHMYVCTRVSVFVCGCGEVIRDWFIFIVAIS